MKTDAYIGSSRSNRELFQLLVYISDSLIMNMRIRSGSQKNWALALRRCDVFPLDINLVYKSLFSLVIFERLIIMKTLKYWPS